MHKLLQTPITVFLAILCFNTVVFADFNADYCKYSDDPIIVESDHFRQFLQLSGTENLLTLCNLKPGEKYTISGFNELDQNCSLSFNLPGKPDEEGRVIFHNFKADSDCMDIELQGTNCPVSGEYPAWISIVCQTCPQEQQPVNSSFLPPITVDQSLSVEQLIQDIFIGGDCFDVENVTAIGGPNGKGLFVDGLSTVGMDKGVILSTGNTLEASGPCGPNASTSNGGAGDADLAQLAGINVADACGIEFDFVPTLDALTFDFAFASEEYCEFVGSYNDAFGFFISGPGINGPFANGAENIALITGTNTNVAINTVNQNTNTVYFNPNSIGTCGGETNCADIKYDGYTAVFTAEITGLTACETYHIKLVIADANDQIYDSAVFLGKGSFDAGGDLTLQSVVPNTNGNTAIEACQDGQLIFTRNAIDLDQPLTITFDVGGTATAGLDYVPFPTTITFPPNQQVYIIDVDILSDALAEGQENITIILDQDACSCTGQAGELIIEDYVPMDIATEDITVCGTTSSTIAPNITGGAPFFNYQWSNGATSPTITVSPPTTTTYTVTVTDQCGNTEEGSATINVEQAPTASLSGNAAVCAGDPNPSATLTVTFTGSGPWDLVYSFNGVPQPIITGIMDNPFDLVVNGVGNYALVSVENAACPGTASGQATVSEVDVNLAIMPDDVECNGGQSGSVDLSVLSGDSPYTFEWSNGAFSEDLFNVGIGTYTVTVTDINGCTEVASAQINEPPLLQAQTQITSPILCNGDFSGSINASANGGSPSYTYSWSNGGSGPIINQVTAGDYCVTITDQNNCTAVSCETLTEPDPLDADVFLVQNVSCAGGMDGAADLTVFGGTTPYFYNWSGGIGGAEDPNNFSAGTYTVEITDINGCTTTASISVSEPPPLIAVAQEAQNVDCNNPNGGAIDLVLAGGTPGYSFQWSNGSFEEDPTNLMAGDYTVTVTDALGCTETVTATVTQDDEVPDVQAEVQGIISCIDTEATLDGSNSSGNGTISFEWQDPNGNTVGNDPVTNVSIPGDYILIVTNDGNGCTNAAMVTVDQNNDEPVAVANVSGTITCNTEIVTLDGSGSTGVGTLSYEWQDANGNTVSGNDITNVNLAGDYTLIVTDDNNGCTAEVVVAVTEDTQAPDADILSNGDLTCTQTSVTLDGSNSNGNGSLEFEWIDENNDPVGFSPTLDITNPGDYTLIVTDTQNGCTGVASVVVDEDTNDPVPDAQVDGIIDCFGEDATLDGSGSTANGSLSYEWQDNGGATVGTTASVDVSTAGTYTLIITDDDNGCTAQTTVEVMEDIEAPVPDASSSGTLTCTVNSVSLDGGGSTGNGALDYEWQDAGGANLGTTQSIDVSVSGTYTLIITDTGNGCTAATTIDVAEDTSNPTPDAVADGILTCTDESVQLDGGNSNGNGTLSFEWQDDSGTTLGGNSTVDVATPGTYTLIVTDEDNGCTAETTVDVGQDIAEPSADAGPAVSLTCSSSEATLDGSGSSSGPNISYTWLNAGNVTVGTSVTVDVTQTGTYTLIVTNEDNGCTDLATVECTPDDDLPTADAGTGSTLTCVVDQATLDGTGSSTGANITYEWLDPNNTSIAVTTTTDVTIPGTYTLVVTNTDNDCSATSSVEVSEDIADPVANAGPNELLTCAETTATLNGSGSTGNNLMYEWFNPGGTSIGSDVDVNVAEPGEYTLVVTDGDNGCTAQSTVEVIPDANLPTADAGENGLLTCAVTQTTLDGSNSSGGTLSYDWQDSNGATIGSTAMIDVANPGTYTLVVTDEDNGCSASAVVEVTEDVTPPVAEAGDNSLLNCNISNSTLDGSGSTGNGTLEYEWQNSGGMVLGTSVSIDVDQTDTYTLIVTNVDNGCTSSDNVTVNPDFDAPMVDAGPDGLLTCADVEATLDGSGSTGGNNLSFTWFDPSNAAISTDPAVIVNSTGTYTLVVTNDDNGCSESSTVNVGEDVNAPTADAGTGSSLTCDQTAATLDGSNSSIGNNFIYEWQNSGGVTVGNTTVVDVAQTGVYTLIVTNTDNGCTATDQVEITPDANLPTADAGTGNTITCSNPDAILDGSGSTTGATIDYEWQDNNGATVSTNTMVTVSTPGIYTLIVTDTDNGCSATANVEIFENTENPTADAGQSPTLDCANTVATLDGSGSTISSGSLTYEWTDANDITLGANVTLDVTDPGIYTLLVTGDNGCTATTQLEVFQDIAIPTADAGADNTLDCEVTSLTLGGPGTSTGNNITYEWVDENAVVVATTETLDVTEPGVYTLTVLNTDNNCFETASVIIDQQVDLPQVDVGADGLLTCFEEEITIGGPGTSAGVEFSYEWTNSAGMVVGNDISTTIDQPDTYTLTVVNEMTGCSEQASVLIDQDIAAPTADAGNGGVLTCNITEITLDGSASSGNNLTFEWFNAANVLVDDQMITQVSQTGDYTLVVTNSFNGCTSTAQVSITPDENLPTAVATPDGILTCEVIDVTLDGSGSSTISGNIAYEWIDENDMTVSTMNSITLNSPGIYTLIVTDMDNGCTSSVLTEAVQDIEDPQADAGQNQTLTCDQTVVTLTGSAANGTNLSYEWQDGNGMTIANTATTDVSIPDTYELTVINLDNGCSSTAQVSVTPDTNLPTVEAGMSSTLTCAVQDVTLDGTGSSTGANIQYEWQNQAGTVISTDLVTTTDLPGTYTLYVYDASNGCESQDQVIIAEDTTPPDALIDTQGSTSLDCNETSLVLDGSISGPSNDLSFAWTTNDGNIMSGANTSNPEIDAPGTYVLTVTSLTNGCTATASITINENTDDPSITIFDPETLTCDVIETMLTASIATTQGNVDITWTSNPGGGIVSGTNDMEAIVNQPGTYTITVIDPDNGCQSQESIVVDEDTTPPDAVASATDEFDCVIESVSLDGTGSSSGANFTYEWTGAGTIDGNTTLSPLVYVPGTYNLLVTNTSTGCTNTASVEVEEDDSVPTAADVLVEDPPCFGDDGSINVLSITGGTAPFMYSLDGGDNFTSSNLFTNLDPGTYNILIQDATGCEHEEQVTINAVNELDVDLETQVQLNLGDLHQLEAIVNTSEDNIAEIIWAPANGLSCTDCLNPIATPDFTTTYTVTVVNLNGCVATAQITIVMKKTREVFIPNAFSPNDGDGLNDIFLIFANGDKVRQVNKFLIFDRWGELIYEAYNFQPNNPDNGWNGKLRGETLNPAVFVYLAEIEFIDGVVEKFKGDVTLMD